MVIIDRVGGGDQNFYDGRHTETLNLLIPPQLKS